MCQSNVINPDKLKNNNLKYVVIPTWVHLVFCFFTTNLIEKFYLQSKAVVCGGFVFAAVVLTVINVDVVQLQEADQISRRLQREKDTA